MNSVPRRSTGTERSKESRKRHHERQIYVVALVSELGPILRKWIADHDREYKTPRNEKGEFIYSALNGAMTGIQALCAALGWNDRNLYRFFNESFYSTKWDHILQSLELTHLTFDGTIHLVDIREAKRMLRGEHLILNRAQVVGLYAIAMEHGVSAKLQTYGGGSAQQVFDAAVEVTVDTDMGQYRYRVQPSGERMLVEKVEHGSAPNGPDPSENGSETAL